MPKPNLLFFVYTVVSLCCVPWQPEAAATTSALPEIPLQAGKAQQFAPAPWHVDSLATGDLNRDGLPDAALIVSTGDGGVPSHRKLIVALKKNGGYEKVVESDKACALALGPSGGIPSVTIAKQVLSVEHYFGARERYECLHKYQMRDGRFILIGFTSSSSDTLDLDSGRRLDLNTMTGEVSSSCRTSKGKVYERLKELWAAPISAEEPSPSDWGAPAVHLSGTDSKGKVGVTLQAVHSRDRLFVKAQLSDGRPLTSGEISLIDAKGNVIHPDSSRATIYGYRVNTYDLHSSVLRDLFAKTDSSGQHLLRLSVSVRPHAGSKLVLSTAGKLRPGVIFISNSKGAPDITDIDVRDGEPIHPFFHYDEI